MSGKLEKELKTRKAIIEKLIQYPSVFKEFYYDMENSNKSYKTMEKYINYLIEFASFVGGDTIEQEFFKNVTQIDIGRYMESIKLKTTATGNVSETSNEIRATKWSAINAFFIFLKNNDYIDENPMDKTKRPKAKTEHHVTYLSKEEIAAMLQKVKDEAIPRFLNRDLCVLTLAITTGLPVTAICNINIDDVDLDNNIISVTEINHKRREISFGGNVKEYMEAWLKDRRRYFGDTNSDALFVSQKRERLSTDMVRRMLTKYTRGVTEKAITPHSLRATFAVNIFKKTNSISIVADMLGTDTVMAAEYAKAAVTQKNEAAVLLLDDLV